MTVGSVTLYIFVYLFIHGCIREDTNAIYTTANLVLKTSSTSSSHKRSKPVDNIRQNTIFLRFLCTISFC